MKDRIELGDKVRDTINGLTGIVVQVAECLHGCRRIQVDPDKLKEDGSPLDGWWIDEHRLKILKKGVVPAVRPTVTQPEIRAGGPNTRA